MLEKQFIKFSQTIPDQEDLAVPVDLGASGGISFYVGKLYDGSGSVSNLRVVSQDGTAVYSTVPTRTAENDDAAYFQNVGRGITAIPVYGYFRLAVDITDGELVESTYYSNLLQNLTGAVGLSRVSYWCNGYAMGFPFIAGCPVELNIPIRIADPQYEQDDKVYTKSNGEQVVLYSTIQKEYDGETEYVPGDWHEKIVTALSCDLVYIDGEHVTKSESYSIAWDNYTFDDCGNRIARATFKVKTNVIARNSNCG